MGCRSVSVAAGASGGARSARRGRRDHGLLDRAPRGRLSRHRSRPRWCATSFVARRMARRFDAPRAKSPAAASCAKRANGEALGGNSRRRRHERSPRLERAGGCRERWRRAPATSPSSAPPRRSRAAASGGSAAASGRAGGRHVRHDAGRANRGHAFGRCDAAQFVAGRRDCAEHRAEERAHRRTRRDRARKARYRTSAVRDRARPVRSSRGVRRNVARRRQCRARPSAAARPRAASSAPSLRAPRAASGCVPRERRLAPGTHPAPSAPRRAARRPRVAASPAVPPRPTRRVAPSQPPPPRLDHAAPSGDRPSFNR